MGVCTLAASAALALVGCAGDGANERPRGASENETLAPIIAGDASGLETRMWITDAVGESFTGAIDRAIAQSPGDVPTFGPADRATWQRAAVELRGVELGAVPDLLDGLPTHRRMDREYLGQSMRWTPLVESLPVEAGTAVLTPAGEVTLPAGRLVLQARSWLAPALAGTIEPVLRVELRIVHVPRPGRSLRLTDPVFDEAQASAAVVSGLSASAEVRRDQAVLITFAESGVSIGSTGGVQGPASPTSQSLGSVLFTGSTRLGDIVTPTRVAVVLIPRLPARYRLLPE